MNELQSNEAAVEATGQDQFDAPKVAVETPAAAEGTEAEVFVQTDEDLN